MKANSNLKNILKSTKLISLFFVVGCTSTTNELINAENLQTEIIDNDPVVEDIIRR